MHEIAGLPPDLVGSAADVRYDIPFSRNAAGSTRDSDGSRPLNARKREPPTSPSESELGRSRPCRITKRRPSSLMAKLASPLGSAAALGALISTDQGFPERRTPSCTLNVPARWPDAHASASRLLHSSRPYCLLPDVIRSSTPPPTLKGCVDVRKFRHHSQGLEHLTTGRCQLQLGGFPWVAWKRNRKRHSPRCIASLRLQTLDPPAGVSERLAQLYAIRAPKAQGKRKTSGLKLGSILFSRTSLITVSLLIRAPVSVASRSDSLSRTISTPAPY